MSVPSVILALSQKELEDKLFEDGLRWDQSPEELKLADEHINKFNLTVYNLVAHQAQEHFRIPSILSIYSKRIN
jgi:hypothetical protein